LEAAFQRPPRDEIKKKKKKVCGKRGKNTSIPRERR